MVVEGWRAGRIGARGVGPEAVWPRSRRVSFVSISSFGRGGPWSRRPATEFTLQAWCGSTAARGTPDRPPLAAGGRLGEWLGGAYAAAVALTVGHGGRRDGRGGHVDPSLPQVVALPMAPKPNGVGGLPGRPRPVTRTLEIPASEPARDGWVGFCTITAQQWRDFLVLIERPDLIDDEALARWDERVRRAPEVNALIHGWTRRHSVAEIVERAAALRIPVAAVGTGETVTSFDHFVARGAFVPHPGAGFVQPRPPYRLSDATLRPLAPAPRLGADAPAWPEGRGIAGAPARPARGLPRRARGPSGRPPPGRPAHHRLPRLLGRAVRHPVPRRHGRRRHQGRVHPAPRRDALPERPAAEHRWLVGVERALPDRQPRQ